MPSLPNDSWVEKIITRIHAAATSPEEIVGVAEEDVATLAERYRCKFPQEYCYVLQCIGRGAGAILDRNEFEFYYDQLIELNDYVRLEHGQFLSQAGFDASDVFVIRGRYREQFEFVLCDGSRDPHVHYFNTWDLVVVDAYPSVREWLQQVCADELRL